MNNVYYNAIFKASYTSSSITKPAYVNFLKEIWWWIR